LLLQPPGLPFEAVPQDPQPICVIDLVINKTGKHCSGLQRCIQSIGKGIRCKALPPVKTPTG